MTFEEYKLGHIVYTPRVLTYLKYFVSDKILQNKFLSLTSEEGEAITFKALTCDVIYSSIFQLN